jgi:SAM-dependent methyltransferase
VNDKRGWLNIKIENKAMSSYTGRHALLYDIFYAEKNYTKEAFFIQSLVNQHYKNQPSKKMLELACGTGNHAFELENLDFQIQAFDYSTDMIGRAKEKAIEKQSKVSFDKGDMRQLPNFDEKFDVAICLFDSIGYVLTNEAITQVFNGVRQNLKDKGIFIFEFWHAPAMLKSFDPVRVKRWKLADREILRISETSIAIPTQTSTVNYNIYELFPNGTFLHLQEAHQNRFFQLQEMIFLVKNTGFKVVSYFDGYENNTKIDSQTWHIVMIVEKI